MLYFGNAYAAAASLDFALHLNRGETTLRNSTQNVSTTVKRVGISAFEASDPMVQLGLRAGYAYLSHTGDPLTAGMNLQGYYGGVDLRSVLLDRAPLQAALSAGYLYQNVDDAVQGQRVSLEWHDLLVRLAVALRMSPRTTVHGGVIYGRIDAEQKATGTVNLTQDLDTGTEPGGFIGFSLDTGGGGNVGIQLQRGHIDEFNIYFQRWF